MDWIQVLLSRCAALIHAREPDDELLTQIELATEEYPGFTSPLC